MDPMGLETLEKKAEGGNVTMQVFLWRFFEDIYIYVASYMYVKRDIIYVFSFTIYTYMHRMYVYIYILYSNSTICNIIYCWIGM